MRYLSCALFLVGILPASLAAENLSLTKCPDATLYFYETNFASPVVGAENGPCSSGILNFSQFTFQAFGEGAVGADQINLSPIDPGTAELGSTGFTISGLTADAGQSLTYVIDWYFAIDAGPRAGGASLGMDPPYGDVTITQSYCVDSFMSEYSPNGFSCGVPGAEFGSPPQSLTVTVPNPDATITFRPEALSFADVRTVIQLNGGQTGAGFDMVSGATNIYDPTVPEPATLLLIPGALYLLRRRVVKSRT
jgi:hypothetical protein